MALQHAYKSKNSSMAAAIQTKAILTSLAMGVIDAEIITQSTRTDTDEQIYKARINFKATVNSTTNMIELIQSDETKVLLVDVERALIDHGYRVACKHIKEFRAGVDDKVRIQVAWD